MSQQYFREGDGFCWKEKGRGSSQQREAQDRIFYTVGFPSYNISGTVQDFPKPLSPAFHKKLRMSASPEPTLKVLIQPDLYPLHLSSIPKAALGSHLYLDPSK